MEERLQKILAGAGVASRRRAEELIRQGRVTVDGRVVIDMGVKVDPARQQVCVNGRPVEVGAEKIYILLNKPTGYVTTLDDPQGRPIVTSLLPGIMERVFPVGRLDLDTEGALLLTNDGELAQRVLHPSFEVKKTYVATVVGTPSLEKLSELETGVMVDGRRTSPARVRMLRHSPRFSLLEITIHEGRKRQVRKMCAAIGHRVLALRRIAYGNLRLGDLPTGKYRRLSRKEVEKIFSP